MVSIQDFKVRVSSTDDSIGIKESFSTLRDGEDLIVSAVFGIDSTLSPTKPVVYTRDGYVDLKSILPNGLVTKGNVENAVSAKRGFYTAQSSAVMLCIFKGRLHNGVWHDSTVCDFYVPVGLEDSDGNPRLSCVKVADRSVLGCLTFPAVVSVEEKIRSFMARSCNSRADFFYNRLI